MADRKIFNCVIAAPHVLHNLTIQQPNSPKVRTVTNYMAHLIKKRAAAQRLRIFSGGVETLVLPNAEIQGKKVEWLLAHEGARSKSGTRARALIEYFHYPVNCHQENLEDSPLHLTLAKATERILSMPSKQLNDIAARHLAHLAELIPAGKTHAVLRLRETLLPLIAKIFHSIIFNAECADEVASTLAANTRNVLRTIKGLSLPDFVLRQTALACIEKELARQSGCEHLFADDNESVCELSMRIRAKHIQGVFFNTGMIQVSEFASHALVAVAQHPDVEQTLLNHSGDNSYIERVLTETLRMFPLFGVTNRVSTEDIALADGLEIKQGVQLLFNFEQHQRVGYEAADTFNPDRWKQTKTSEANYMPFGAGHRRCPAERISRALTKAILLAVLRHYRIHAPIIHDRPLEGGGLCCAFRRGEETSAIRFREALLAYVRMRDRTEHLINSMAKLITFPRIDRAAHRPIPPVSSGCPFRKMLRTRRHEETAGHSRHGCTDA
ncbi:cytochrome P450 [Paraburkholderia graminis]|nr:cytochrome P450 [Paraburkholderia graminis]